MYFRDKSVAIVGLGGMGREIVRMLAGEGVKTFFLADYNPRASIEASIDISEINRDSLCFADSLDVANAKSRERWVEIIKKTQLPVDIFIYTAGIIGPGGKSKFVTKWTKEDFDQVFCVNSRGMALLMIDFVNTFFTPQKYGYIITIASMAGMDPQGGSEMYDASKAWDIAFMRAFGQSMDIWRERKGIDIKSNCIAPRMVRTGMISHLEENKELMDGLLARFKQSELSEPSDVADQVYHLLDGNLHGCIVEEKGYDLIPILNSVMEQIQPV